MTARIVVGERVLLDAGFHATRARLEILARDGMLLWPSEVAYGEGITSLVELAGPAAGLTRLAGIRLDDLAHTHSCAHIPLQWEAIAADGKLFTALDADLMLVPAGDQVTALALAGAYRLQPGRAGAEVDPVIVRLGATAAIGSFLAWVACALVHPAGTAGPEALDHSAARSVTSRNHRDLRIRNKIKAACAADSRKAAFRLWQYSHCGAHHERDQQLSFGRWPSAVI